MTTMAGEGDGGVEVDGCEAGSRVGLNLGTAPAPAPPTEPCPLDPLKWRGAGGPRLRPGLRPGLRPDEIGAVRGRRPGSSMVCLGKEPSPNGV